MALHESTADLEARGATITATTALPAHILFGANADDIVSRDTRPEENIQELELRVRAGNAQGMADGYFSSSQFLDEDGNVQTEEEKAKKERQRMQRSGMMVSTSAMTISIETYNAYTADAHRYYNEQLEINKELDAAIAAKSEELAALESEKGKILETIANSPEAAELLAAQANSADIRARQSEVGEILANVTAAQNNPDVQIGMVGFDPINNQYYIAAMVPLSVSPDGMALIALEDDKETPLKDENGNVITRSYVEGEVLFGDDVDTFATATTEESVDLAAEGAAAEIRENLAQAAYDRLHGELQPRLQRIELQLSLGYSDMEDLQAQRAQGEINAQLYGSMLDNEDLRTRIENGEPLTEQELAGMAAINERRVAEGLSPLDMPGQEAGLMPNEGTQPTWWDSIVQTASEGYQAATEFLTQTDQAIEDNTKKLNELEEAKSYLTQQLEELNSDQTRQDIAEGKISDTLRNSMTSYYGTDGVISIYQELGITQTENMSVADPSIYSPGGMREKINMSLPQGYIGEDGIWIPNDPYGVDAHIPAARNSVMSASADDGLGITNQSVTPKSDFSVAASGAPVNQSTVDPAQIAQLQASLKTGTETQQVAMANTGAYTP